MAIRRTLAQFSDEIVATDLADNSVTTAKIADSQITAAKVAADVATQAELNTVSAAVDAVDTSAGIKPHIRTNVLYPGIVDKQLDGTALAVSTTGPNSSTVASSKYGTVQSDGRMYYYTAIKGSRPIEDPRIGAQFGSNRHRFSSLQPLEQETGTHGQMVFSIDGRSWARAVSPDDNSGSYKLIAKNTGDGAQIQLGRSTDHYVEITGYFSDMNWIQYTNANRKVERSIDGGAMSTADYGNVTTGTPLSGRYLMDGSVVNLALGQTLGIHTVKILEDGSDDTLFHGIELIAQDTTSTATKSQIQIPSQNVVSYGKKFTVSGTPHYNPFDGLTGAKTLAQLGDYIDTATSLGMENWKGGTANYHKPFNGGRVVKWVDSSGTIKTSVTMMPPNAQNIGGTASNAVSDAHIIAGTNDDTINFNTSAIDHSLSEVAKTFHFREFGNGNQNRGDSGAGKDFTMTDGNADKAYVMDDGLTGMAAGDASVSSNLFMSWASGTSTRTITFIGTGITIHSGYNVDTSAVEDNFYTIAQNLPYGTHLYSKTHPSHNILIDSIEVESGNHPSNYWKEVTFHQPKKPPVPENAVVLADYMLMADFVKQTTAGYSIVSKGVRIVSSSRDVFYNSGAALTFEAASVSNTSRGAIVYNTNSSSLAKLPFFGTNSVEMGHLRSGSERIVSQFNGSTSSNQTIVHDAAGWGGVITHDGATLGVNTAQVGYSSSASQFQFADFQIVTPIHTSSHYQSFETPYLHELVGGDRNMEQTNLVVTADGKTWDQVTRDTSYIGPAMHNPNTDTGVSGAATTTQIFDEHRGSSVTGADYYSKNFAVAYDRQICLVNGLYHINYFSHRNSSTQHTGRIYVNNVQVAWGHFGTGDHSSCTVFISMQLKRGDYVEVRGDRLGTTEGSKFEITRLD